MWVPRHSAAIAELVMRVEEEEEEKAGVPIANRKVGEKERVYEPIVPDEAATNPSQIILLMKPEGPMGGLRTRIEYVTWR